MRSADILPGNHIDFVRSSSNNPLTSSFMFRFIATVATLAAVTMALPVQDAPTFLLQVSDGVASGSCTVTKTAQLLADGARFKETDAAYTEQDPELYKSVTKNADGSFTLVYNQCAGSWWSSCPFKQVPTVTFKVDTTNGLKLTQTGGNVVCGKGADKTCLDVVLKGTTLSATSTVSYSSILNKNLAGAYAAVISSFAQSFFDEAVCHKYA